MEYNGVQGKSICKYSSFSRSFFVLILLKKYKMNETMQKFILAGDKFLPEMLLIQAGFIYRSCGPFTKNKKSIQKLKEIGDSRYIYRNKLDKACFWGFKNLTKRTACNKILHNKEFNISKKSKYYGYLLGIASMVYKFFQEKLVALVLKIKLFLIKN